MQYLKLLQKLNREQQQNIHRIIAEYSQNISTVTEYWMTDYANTETEIEHITETEYWKLNRVTELTDVSIQNKTEVLYITNRSKYTELTEYITQKITEVIYITNSMYYTDNRC